MSHKTVPVIVWFRQDLRLSDNPALTAAARHGPVIPLFIYDDTLDKISPSGSASAWWLRESIQQLNNSIGGRLLVSRGNAQTVLTELIAHSGASAVYWNRIYDPDGILRDTQIKHSLTESGIDVNTSNGSLLREPWTVLKPDGSPYRVFTAFYRRGYSDQPDHDKPIPQRESIEWFDGLKMGLPEVNLEIPPGEAWSSKFNTFWTPGEKGAECATDRFLRNGLKGYQVGRDFPARQSISRMSPYLHFGEVSSRQLLHNTMAVGLAEGLEEDIACFHRELVWRDFCAYQLFHFPALPRKNLQQHFDRFPWRKDDSSLRLWQKGLTGFPIIDAAMRELWETGFMHNRQRMVTASFLVKNLMIDWREGERWFRHCLLDADLASNSANWQWVAGCGLDAAPYFRIFNPLTQSKKFDAEGHYIRRFVPELANLPDRHIHYPAEAPAEVLKTANVQPGRDYPLPICDLKETRQSALDAFASIRQKSY